jgi:RNA polymerase sigma-70 factor (ECF subfamily)
VEEALRLPATGNEEAADPAIAVDALAERVARGDRAAFEHIYYMFVDELNVYALSHVGEQFDADDAVTSVFLKMWQYARSYRTSSRSYRRWMYGIARNEVRTLIRSRQETVPLAIDLPDDRSPVVAADSRQESLLEAVGRLTPEQREVIVLRYFSGKTTHEIAEIMTKREGSVRALQHRALRTLRKAVPDAAS